MSNESLVTILRPNEPYALPDPASYSGRTSTMTDSGTSVSGKLLGSIVRDDMAQVSLSWNYLEAEIWAEMNQLFRDSYINRLRFFNQTTGSWEERDMFVSDRSAGIWRRDENGTVLGWTGCALTFTEV